MECPSDYKVEPQTNLEMIFKFEHLPEDDSLPF